MDSENWQRTVHGITKSWTRLKGLSTAQHILEEGEPLVYMSSALKQREETQKRQREMEEYFLTTDADTEIVPGEEHENLPFSKRKHS